MGRKLIILAAINGGTQQDREGAVVPTTPAEIAEEAQRCFEAGAAVVHVHARDENKQPTSHREVFSDIIIRIREKCDALIQTTNAFGARYDPTADRWIFPSDEERLSLLDIEPMQDLFSLGGGSWDYYNPASGLQGEPSFVNTTSLLRRNISAVLKKGAAIEMEIVELGFLQKLRRLSEEGIFELSTKRVWLTLGFGFGGMPATPRMIMNAADERQRLFPEMKWEILASGQDQFWVNTMGLLMDCDIVRVGFEDNIHLPNGMPAQRNSQLVEAMARIAREFGREPASADEARVAFGLAERA